MIQYYQLTPDILLEYVYEGDPKLNEDGIKGNEKDIYDSDTNTILLKSSAFGTNYLFFKDTPNSEYGYDKDNLTRLSNLVLPLNTTETQFVIAKSKYQEFYKNVNVSNLYTSKSGSGYLYEDTHYDREILESGMSCDVKYDKCILHFTSKNYFGSYDSLIFQAYAYMKNKAKFYLASFLFKRTSNLDMKAEHLLYNEKLYTTQIEFNIPSVFAILSNQYNPSNSDTDSDDEVNGQIIFNRLLKSQNIELLENTPIGINVYGVSSSTKGTDNYVRLKTLKINSISIPYIYNRLDEIYVNIYEANDGDYYYIDPEIGSGYKNFVDYIESMGEDIHSYIAMHELSLREIWVDTNGVSHSEVTHKEMHILNINEDDEDEDISRRFDAKIKYRPICMKGGMNYKAIIVDTIKIINTVDSSSYEVSGSLEISNPSKYGKKLKKIGIKNESRPIVNVYNKNTYTSRGSAEYGIDTIAGGNSGISGSIGGSIGGATGGGNIGGGSGSGSGSGTGGGSGSGSGSGSGGGTGSGSGSGSGSGGGTGSGGGYGSGYGAGTEYDNSSGATIVISNGAGFVVENMTQNIVSFMECTNVGVSIVELSPDDIN